MPLSMRRAAISSLNCATSRSASRAEPPFFSNLLPEARISLFSFTVGRTDEETLTNPETRTDPETGSDRYMLFLNGVESAQQASLKNLDRKVLAVQSGGRVLGPGNDLVSQIDSCVQEASAFYTPVVRPFPCGSSCPIS